MKALLIGLIALELIVNALLGVVSAIPIKKAPIGVMDFNTGDSSLRYLEKENMLVISDIKQVLGTKRIFWIKVVVVQREAKESVENTEDFLIENGSKLIAEGDYNHVLDLIRNLQEKARHNIQILTLQSFASLKGWILKKDKACQANWLILRTELIKLGDNGATPMLIIFLKDKDPYLRVHAAELLSHIGDERALKDLREKGENDENSQVRKNARWAYEQISGKKF